ncbi:MAG: hypothetical protein JXR77_14005 [Lentisphaeria bacterium]|nr:hypothetical protein [Lentisphaeria bacterium]
MHLGLFDQRNWGLIIYDEVHLLPAPVFQVTATLQAAYRGKGMPPGDRAAYWSGRVSRPRRPGSRVSLSQYSV